jgi:hypothetical protein
MAPFKSSELGRSPVVSSAAACLFGGALSSRSMSGDIRERKLPWRMILEELM